ncbi:6447_t:CDS:2 [Cetraspora pellucida]|uniref:6447_t:CDS:1 n=1 Tax=Cetraspora pellucida TaxID=1433469 RepID=A0A9N8WP18_9GLOM|nr:6447_t:CDS:2 [Cetraspora pellucida]
MYAESKDWNNNRKKKDDLKNKIEKAAKTKFYIEKKIARLMRIRQDNESVVGYSNRFELLAHIIKDEAFNYNEATSLTMKIEKNSQDIMSRKKPDNNIHEIKEAIKKMAKDEDGVYLMVELDNNIKQSLANVKNLGKRRQDNRLIKNKEQTLKKEKKLGARHKSEESHDRRSKETEGQIEFLKPVVL